MSALLALKDSMKLKPFVIQNVKRPKPRIKLGVGSFGSVEELVHGGTTYAGKFFHESLLDHRNEGVAKIVKQVTSECELMVQLHHPNIVQFIGICFLSDHPHPVLLMERMDTSLDNLLVERDRELPQSLKLRILLDITRGLVFLHTKNPQVIHRDLTTRNILLNKNSMKAKIADLGNALIIDPNQLLKTLSRSPGTQIYMSPEAMMVNPNYDASLDIFSYGHLALHTTIQKFPGNLEAPTYIDLKSGKLLARSEVERRQKYIKLLSQKLAGKNHPLVVAIKKCLSDQPLERPTAQQLMGQLEKMITEIPEGDIYELVANKGKLEIVEELIGKKEPLLVEPTAEVHEEMLGVPGMGKQKPRSRPPSGTDFEFSIELDHDMAKQLHNGKPDVLDIFIRPKGLFKKCVWKQYVFRIVESKYLQYSRCGSKIDDALGSLELSSLISIHKVECAQYEGDVRDRPQDTLATFHFKINFNGRGTPWILRACSQEQRANWMMALDPNMRYISQAAPPDAILDEDICDNIENYSTKPDDVFRPPTPDARNQPKEPLPISSLGQDFLIPDREPARDPSRDPSPSRYVRRVYSPPKLGGDYDDNSSPEDVFHDPDEAPHDNPDSHIYDLPQGNDQERELNKKRVSDAVKYTSSKQMQLEMLISMQQMIQGLMSQMVSPDHRSDYGGLQVPAGEQRGRHNSNTNIPVRKISAQTSQAMPPTTVGVPGLRNKFEKQHLERQESADKQHYKNVSPDEKHAPKLTEHAQSSAASMQDNLDGLKKTLRQMLMETKMNSPLSKSLFEPGDCTDLPAWAKARTESITPSLESMHKEALYIQKSCITNLVAIGSGQFGQVYKAKLRRGRKTVEVAVKTVKKHENEKEKQNFLREQTIMSQMMHPNVVRLYGLVQESQWIVLEYLPHGDLKNFLMKNQRPVGRLLKYMLDVAMGMHYISEKGLIHRDIASRNIMVGRQEVCKVGDFGLLREIPKDSNIYVATTKTPVPKRWMAPESLDYENKVFSTASDVWSYGVLLWEMYNPFEAMPYETVDDDFVAMAIREGRRLHIPTDYPIQVQRIMKLCWNKDPAKRPNFLAISNILTSLTFETE